jgi:hypothetical protein
MMPMVKRGVPVAAALAITLSPQLLGLLATHEFHFIRIEYVDLPGARRGWGRGWWRQDWPAAEIHFAQGVQRLTRIDIGEGLHLPLTDDRIFDFPWAYATQVGYWDLSDGETARLREYLLRGGFLMVDDFYGPQDWAVFQETMQRVFPDRPILDLDEGDPVLHVLYDIDQRTQIPGLRHLGIGRGGATFVQADLPPPIWRGVFDDKGRLLVAVNFNMDIGDAWEHADMPEYPEPMTALAYRFGINYIIYSMTH